MGATSGDARVLAQRDWCTDSRSRATKDAKDAVLKSLDAITRAIDTWYRTVSPDAISKPEESDVGSEAAMPE